MDRHPRGEPILYAEVGRNTLDPLNVPSVDVVRELQALLARQPGYRGYIAIEGDNYQRTFIRVWDSADAAKAAREAPELQRFRVVNIAPSVTLNESLGSGPVLHADFTRMYEP